MRRRLAASLLLACLAPLAAWGATPDPAKCTLPAVIHLVGSLGAVPDIANGQFSVTLKDASGAASTDHRILVDFSTCTGLYISQNQLNPNATANCSLRQVLNDTAPDANGMLNMTIVGSALGPTPQPVACARIFARDISTNQLTDLGPVLVTAFDLDAAGGVTASDVSVLITQIGSHLLDTRMDYDLSQTLSPADAAILFTVLGQHVEDVSPAVCP